MKPFSRILTAIFLPVLLMFYFSCQSIRIKEHKEWGVYFEQKSIKDACFEMNDNNKDMVLYYNKDACSKRMIPGATFDIFTAMAALSTSVALNNQFQLEIKDTLNHTSQTLTMEEAFKNGNTAYFEQLASMVGLKQMQRDLDTNEFGNKLIGSDISHFFNNGTLLVTPDEMVGFMKLVYHGKVPAFDGRSIRIVQNLMIQETKPSETLYYRYAAIKGEDSTLHWLVGCMEHFEDLKSPKTGKMQHIPHPYFFAMNFSTPNSTLKDWKAISVDILREILKANHTNK